MAKDYLSPACRPCHSSCRTCYGPSAYHCLSCPDDLLYDYSALGTSCVDTCGDGIKHLALSLSGHLCDDGNLIDGDGCNRYCKPERGWICEPTSPGKADRCYEVCGDGRRVKEECDDGNAKSGDGCSAKCEVEPGWECVGGSTFRMDVCFERCGDGVNLGRYECDDGNTIDGDGCSSKCQVEFGYSCMHSGT